MTDHPRRVTRALLSVSDKSGLIEFARALAGHGIDLVSTGGTAKAIAAAGLKVRDVSELTGFPEMMDGRVKTLHPKVHGGLLAIRDNAEHARSMKDHGIAPIDLLVVNLYPFEATVDKGAGFEECIENIDIGGPAMIRAAAKNHDDVAVVVESQDYQAVLDELAANQGATTLTLRRRLAAKAYARTAAYDAAISNWFAHELKTDAPDFRAFGGRLIQALRYGENPHQHAAFYRTPDKRRGVATTRQLQGKELSYNNINDTDAAYECLGEFDASRTAGAITVAHSPQYFGGSSGLNCLFWNMYRAFGVGQMGDMGAHTMDLVWNAIDAGAPTSIEIDREVSDKYDPNICPVQLKASFEHPANSWRGGRLGFRAAARVRPVLAACCQK